MPAADITSVQRDLANLQKQIKQLSDQSKKETDPKQKADLQKKIIDLNLKKEKLDKEMEDSVADLHSGMELSFEQLQRIKLKKEEVLLVKEFARSLNKGKNDNLSIANNIINHLVNENIISANKKTTKLVADLARILDNK